MSTGASASASSDGSPSLLGRVAVVTGAGRGIGRVIALRLAADGAHLALAGRSLEGLEDTRKAAEQQGVRAAVVSTDVRDEQQVERLAARVYEQFGKVDVLVANSGVGGPTAPLWEVTPEQWADTLAVNLTGVYLCCRALIPAMMERGSGSVIVIGSMSGKRPLVGRTPYCASKMALVGLVRTLAHEVGHANVRVNLVSPGAVEGDRIDWVIQAQADQLGISFAEARERFTANSPLQRLVPPGDVAEAVAFLASDRAASITGDDLNVSAGLVMY